MACAPPAFVRLRSVLTVNTPATEPAEVVVGREVDRLRGRIARVAVSAPDDCIDFSSTSEAGTGTVESNVLHQRCAVELATLERALTAAGYSVVSWRQLRDVSGASSGAALLQAARTLGAQLILDVNALDWISRTRSAVNARWARTLHTSDPAGLLGRATARRTFSSTESLDDRALRQRSRGRTPASDAARRRSQPDSCLHGGWADASILPPLHRRAVPV
jgi:hypothetical protein